MKTQVIDARQQPEAGTQLGGKLIREGGLVAFPTETVYGLGANGLDEEAVLRIFEAKGRPADNPLILHIAKKNEARALWDSVPQKAQQLMDAFWPGPLTLVFTRSKQVPDAVTAGLDTVALRMPSHKTARALIKAAGVPIAAPSANLSGRPSPTTAQHVLEDLSGRIPLILDGGPCAHGLESTVVSVGTVPMILRPGMITQAMLEAVVGPVRLHKSLLQPLEGAEDATSPGMKYRHYAPNSEVLLVTGNMHDMPRAILTLYDRTTAQGKACVIFATKQTRHFYRDREYAIMGDRDRPETLCANLFANLRKWGGEFDLLLCEGIPAEDEGLAFMNRLLRAAGFRCVDARDVQ